MLLKLSRIRVDKMNLQMRQHVSQATSEFMGWRFESGRLKIDYVFKPASHLTRQSDNWASKHDYNQVEMLLKLSRFGVGKMSLQMRQHVIQPTSDLMGCRFEPERWPDSQKNQLRVPYFQEAFGHWIVEFTVTIFLFEWVMMENNYSV